MKPSTTAYMPFIETSHNTVVTRKGQITIPAPIRAALGIKQGDTLAFQLKDNDVRLVPALTLENAYGSVTPLKQPENFTAILRSVKEERAKKTLAKLHIV